MSRNPASALLALFLFVLQVMGPFLHAHAHGQAGLEGLHMHMQTGVTDDPDPSLRSDPGADHWVMAMPQSHKPDSDISLKNTGEPPQLPLVYVDANLTSSNSVRSFWDSLSQAPPGAFPDYVRPLSLAPPLA